MNVEMEEVEEPLLTYWDPSAPPKYCEAPPTFNPVPAETCAFTFHSHPSEHLYQPDESQVLPQNLSYDYQDNLPKPDNDMEDEVIRAAKSMFSKRTRTLLHWMNPEMDKTGLKFDVDDAWNNLPDQEKNLYISQVLGKLTVCATGLMVNSHLENSKILSLHNTEKSLPKPQVKISQQASPQAPRIKRKYTRRKPRQNIMNKLVNETNEPMLSKLNNTTIKPSLNTSSCNNITIVGSMTVPRVKRKYVKRKLTRKKYTRKDKLNTGQNEVPLPLNNDSSSQDKTSECGEGDLWIHHEDDLLLQKNHTNFELLDEEVDQFWENFGDPAKLFRALEIE